MGSKATSRQEGLLRELEELDRRRKQLLADLGRTEEESEEAARAPRGRSVPVRDVVLNALEDLGCIAFSRELMLYLQARYGREVPAARFGSLAKDEQAAFESRRPRPVYLAHGLTSERFEAIKRLWGRSDWPLWMRIVAPTTGRVQHLQMTAALCNVALTAEGIADEAMLKILAADHARDLPTNNKFKRGEFPLERWRDEATELLQRHAAVDRELRQEAAARLERAGFEERAHLFGAPENVSLYEVASSADDR